MRSSLIAFVLMAGAALAVCRPAETFAAGPRAAGPMEVLRKFNISESQMESFFGGQPLGPAEEDVLGKILYHLPRMAKEDIEFWRKKEVSWDQLAAAPTDHRGEIFYLRGRVTRVEKKLLAPEVASRLEFDHYYVATLSIADSAYVAQVCSRFVPAAWKLDAELGEPASADGLFLKIGEPTQDQPTLVFATERVAWHPDRPHPEEQIGPGQVALAQAGVDWGLFEAVRVENGRAIGGPDREPFFQTLAVMAGEAGPKLPRPGADADIAVLLQAGEKHVGQRLSIRGTARRVIKVKLAAPDVRQRFGIEHYYEIDFMLPLAKPLRLTKDAKSKEAVTYSNAFPATLIVPRLPADLEEGDNLHVTVEADATFYRLWTYHSAHASEHQMRQAAPLFMAADAKVVPPPEPPFSANVFVAVAMLLAAGTLVGIYVFFKVADRKAGKAVTAETMAEAIRKGAAQASEEKPDFSGLQ